MLTRVRDREGGYDTGRTHIRATEAVAPAHAAAVVVVVVAVAEVVVAVVVAAAVVVVLCQCCLYFDGNLYPFQ